MEKIIEQVIRELEKRDIHSKYIRPIVKRVIAQIWPYMALLLVMLFVTCFFGCLGAMSLFLYFFSKRQN